MNLARLLLEKEEFTASISEQILVLQCAYGLDTAVDFGVGLG